VRRLASITIPIIGAVIALILVALYIRVLALDLRAVLDSTRMMNYEWPILRDGWIEWAERVLRWGAWPLVITTIAGLALRVRARIERGAWTLGHLGTGLKVVIAAVSFLPFLAFAAPFSLALGVWVLVEIVPWIQWYDNLEKLSDPVLRAVVPGLLVATLLCGSLLLRAALRRPASPGPISGRQRAFRWVFRLAVLVPIALAAVAPLLGVIVHAARVAPVLGKDAVLERRCSGCHDSSAPMYFYKTPGEWKHFLDTTCFHRMDETDMDLSASDRKGVLDFVVGTRSFSDSWIFATRCRRCHVASPLAWDDRAPWDWESITGRVARYSPLYYGPEAREQVLAYLSGNHGRPEQDTQEARLERRVVQACTSCHFFDREADAWKGAPREKVLDLVRRMGARLESPLEEGEIPGIAEVWQGAIRDGKRLKSLVPHDRHIRKGGLPW
jgi:hypothetical protein